MDVIIFHETSWGGASHIAVIEAVHEAGYTCLVKDDSPEKTYSSNLKKAGISFLDWDSFVTDGMKKNASQESAGRIEGLLELLKKPEIKTRFESKSGNFLSKKADSFFRTLLSQLESQILQIDVLKSIQSQYDITLIVLGSDSEPEARAVSAFASLKSIPTLSLQRGFGEIDLSAIDTLDPAGEGKIVSIGEMQAGLPAFSTQAVIVDGELMQNAHVKWGADPEKVFVTGSTLYDVKYPVSRITESERLACKQELGFTSERPVLVTSVVRPSSAPYFFDRDAAYVSAYHEALGKVARESQAQLLIWPALNEAHGPQDASVYKAILKREGLDDVIVLESGNDRLLNAADVAVCPSDASGALDFLLADVPLIYVQQSTSMPGVLGSCDEIIRVSDPQALSDVLLDLFRNEEKREQQRKRQVDLMARLNFNNDGKAAKRLSHMMLKYASRRGEFTSSQWSLEVKALEKKASYEDLIQQKLASLVIDTD